MLALKRVELVIESHQGPKLLAALAKAGIHRYTTIRDATGRGDRGEVAGDELTEAFNWYVLIACREDELEPLTAAVKPLLAQHGGMCLISDAQWLIH